MDKQKSSLLKIKNLVQNLFSCIDYLPILNYTVINKCLRNIVKTTSRKSKKVLEAKEVPQYI